jgi:hypothetical protein
MESFWMAESLIASGRIVEELREERFWPVEDVDGTVSTKFCGTGDAVREGEVASGLETICGGILREATESDWFVVEDCEEPEIVGSKGLLDFVESGTRKSDWVGVGGWRRADCFGLMGLEKLGKKGLLGLETKGLDWDEIWGWAWVTFNSCEWGAGESFRTGFDSGKWSPLTLSSLSSRLRVNLECSGWDDAIDKFDEIINGKKNLFR